MCRGNEEMTKKQRKQEEKKKRVRMDWGAMMGKGRTEKRMDERRIEAAEKTRFSSGALKRNNPQISISQLHLEAVLRTHLGRNMSIHNIMRGDGPMNLMEGTCSVGNKQLGRRS